MISEKLNILINEFVADGIISSNELALLKEKAKEENVTTEQLDQLIAKALSSNNDVFSNSDLSGFETSDDNSIGINYQIDLDKSIADDDLSGFQTAESTVNNDELSGFETINRSVADVSEKSIFEQQDSFFKNEQLLSKQGNMSQISIGTRHIRKVIIKRLKPEDTTNQTLIELLYKEFQNGLILEHPNIVRVYDSGHDEKGPYYYMEYVDGRTLGKLSQKFGIQSHHQVKKFALEILSALDYVHKKQVFHRDLKPDNILITYKGDNVKILDFGLALTDDFADTMTKVGTPKYASPEQMNNDFKVDGRSDIYSFGLILTEMLTGDCRNIEKVGTYSKKLKLIIQKCTEILPHNRYFSAFDVKNDLEIIQILNNKFVDSEAQVIPKVTVNKAEPSLDIFATEKSVENKQTTKPVEIKKQIPPKIQKPSVKRQTAPRKKSWLGVWLFIVIILISGYYIGTELNYWNLPEKTKIINKVEEPQYMYINANKLRLRSSKDLQKKNVIGLYHKGTKLEVLEIDQEWAKVRIEDKEGYMAFPLKYLSKEIIP